MNKIKSWLRGLRGKLLMATILPVLCLSCMTYLSVSELNRLGDDLENVYVTLIPSLDNLGQITTYRASVGYFFWAAYGTKDPAASDEFVKKARRSFELLKKYQDAYEKTPQSLAGEKDNYKKVQEGRTRYNELTEMIMALLSKNTPEDDAKALTQMEGGEWHKMTIDIRLAVEANTALYQKEATERNIAQQKERKVQIQLLSLVAAFSIFALAGILMWIAYRVSNSVSGISDKLNNAGQEVSLALTQLSTAGQSLSNSSTLSAASLEQTVASLEEMSSMVKMNSNNAQQAAALSESSKAAAEEGQKEIISLIDSMKDISSSSKKIAEIISVIDDIAFQTNLLALNAAVEAARAGEQGKGFAVVADAVRALAQRSAVAAKDINVLIQESVEKVDRGAALADKSGVVLQNIVTSVKKVSDLNTEISTASTEQTTGIQQISQAMNHLDQGTQSNAAASEEIAASTEEISAQAQQMENLVQDLQVVINGSASSKTAPAPVEYKSVKAPLKSTAPVKSKETPKAPEGTAKAEKAPEVKKPVLAKILPLAVNKKDTPKPEETKNTLKKNEPVKQVSAIKKKQEASAAVIPFDEDDQEDPLRKVGTTDGF